MLVWEVWMQWRKRSEIGREEFSDVVFRSFSSTVHHILWCETEKFCLDLFKEVDVSIKIRLVWTCHCRLELTCQSSRRLKNREQRTIWRWWLRCWEMKENNIRTLTNQQRSPTNALRNPLQDPTSSSFQPLSPLNSASLQTTSRIEPRIFRFQ